MNTFINILRFTATFTFIVFLIAGMYVALEGDATPRDQTWVCLTLIVSALVSGTCWSIRHDN